MRGLLRWHRWLGWIAALPLLLWTASGLFMTLRPIEEVRGEHLRAKAEPFAMGPFVLPALAGDVGRLELVQQGEEPVWIATLANGSKLRFSARDGTRLPATSRADAAEAAQSAFVAPPRLTTIRRFSADDAPIDLRRPRPNWQASFDDGSHVYIDAETGEVLALRTRLWRAFDFMWGLHIMDPLGREDTSHPLLWIGGAMALLSTLAGTVLLFRQRRAR